jgi:hypothetical protein
MDRGAITERFGFSSLALSALNFRKCPEPIIIQNNSRTGGLGRNCKPYPLFDLNQ